MHYPPPTHAFHRGVVLLAPIIHLLFPLACMQENHRLGGAFQWPSLREVMEYRKQVSDVIVEVIDNAPLQLPVTFDHPWVHT